MQLIPLLQILTWVGFGDVRRCCAGSNGRVKWHAVIEPATRWSSGLAAQRSAISFADQ